MPSHREPTAASATTRPRSARMPLRLGPVHALTGALATAYFLWLLLDPGRQPATWLDGWVVDGFEIGVSALCVSRGLTARRGRRLVPLALGAGILSWSFGDIVATVESLGGGDAPTPSLADAFYLGYYLLTYLGVVAFIRRELRGAGGSGWMDGIIAGLGAAAACAAFAFQSIVAVAHTSPLVTATDLAYPAGDLLLFGLVVGGTVLVPGARSSWVMLATACVIDALGDTANLLHESLGATHFFGAINSSAWPAAMVLTSAAVWQRRRPADPLVAARPQSFLLPGMAVLASIALLLVSALHRLGAASIVLSVATLVAGGVRFFVSVRSLRTLTQQRHLESITDQLTGMGNRRQLISVLDAYFGDEAGGGSSLAFLFVDLDRFKEVNDSFGHSAGDELLAQIRPRLHAVTGPRSVVTRLGGDEFALVLFGADATGAAEVGRRLRASLEQPFVIGGVRTGISASIGIAVAPTHATDRAALMRGADLAMYRAKVSGSGVEVYDAELDSQSSQLQLLEELTTAVAGGGLVVHYQPQMDLRTGELCALEALVRWPHARLGMVPPLEWLPMAEQGGLMPSVTAWVLDQSLEQCATWRRAGHRVAISVNISVTDLLDGGFTEGVRTALGRHGLPGTALVLEITETSVITNYHTCKLTIEALRDLGLTVSIDDFGAGFTSLAYLGDLAVGELKLDRAFVAGLAGSRPRDLELVRSTIELGHALGLRVVAEGIEDRTTLELLTMLGCDYAQGYFIARPAAPRDITLERLEVAAAVPA